MPAAPRPPPEVEITLGLVRALLAEQHPDLADRPLAIADEGWDNVVVRIGDDLVARLPRRAVAVDLLRNEMRALPSLAPGLPLETSLPVRVGRPGPGYPWPWAIVRWFDGDTALRTPPTDPVATAEVLGRFVAALHQPAPDDAPHNPVRGVGLDVCDPRVRERVEAVGDAVDGAAVLATWDELRATPSWAGPALWLHGDLHPGNLIVRHGVVVAAIDWGDVTAGDPASDLAVAWMLFDEEARPVFVDATGHDDEALWRRARAWALHLGLAILAASADTPEYSRLAHATLARALTP